MKRGKRFCWCEVDTLSDPVVRELNGLVEKRVHRLGIFRKCKENPAVRELDVGLVQRANLTSMRDNVNKFEEGFCAARVQQDLWEIVCNHPQELTRKLADNNVARTKVDENVIHNVSKEIRLAFLSITPCLESSKKLGEDCAGNGLEDVLVVNIVWNPIIHFSKVLEIRKEGSIFSTAGAKNLQVVHRVEVTRKGRIQNLQRSRG